MCASSRPTRQVAGTPAARNPQQAWPCTALLQLEMRHRALGCSSRCQLVDAHHRSERRSTAQHRLWLRVVSNYDHEGEVEVEVEGGGRGQGVARDEKRCEEGNSAGK